METKTITLDAAEQTEKSIKHIKHQDNPLDEWNEDLHKKHNLEALQAIGEEEVCRLFSYPECELEVEFVGFMSSYADLKDLPKDFTVIDLGCNQAFQGAFFKDHERYIGVEASVPEQWRLRQDNADYYEEMGQRFIQETLPKLIAKGLDLEKTMAVCSYVPDRELQQMVADVFPYHIVVYCDDMISERYPQAFLERSNEVKDEHSKASEKPKKKFDMER